MLATYKPLLYNSGLYVAYMWLIDRDRIDYCVVVGSSIDFDFKTSNLSKRTLSLTT
jgi:hypothetical protein